MRLDKDKWQKAFEKELDKAEKRQLSKVRRYYKEQYFRGVNSFLSANQTTFQLLFDTSDIIKIYRDYTRISVYNLPNGMQEILTSILKKELIQTNLLINGQIHLQL